MPMLSAIFCCPPSTSYVVSPLNASDFTMSNNSVSIDVASGAPDGDESSQPGGAKKIIRSGPSMTGRVVSAADHIPERENDDPMNLGAHKTANEINHYIKRKKSKSRDEDGDDGSNAGLRH